MEMANIQHFLNEVASNSPAPGGGSVSALSGAIGAALISMVANLTLGKKKFKDEEPLMKEILENASRVKTDLVKLMEEDTAAFNEVADVFKMPKDTEEQKEKRKKAMQEALKHATMVPFTTMEKAVYMLMQYERALGHTNPSTASDFGVGILCLETALKGAWLNVKINLDGIEDESFVQEYEKKSKELLEKGAVIAQKIYNEALMSFSN